MHQGPSRRTIGDVARELGLRIIDTHRRGLKVVWTAPALLVPLAIVELAQHVVEMRLGMFDSFSAARLHQHAPLRSQIGMTKVFVSWLTALLVARLWANGGSLRQALRVPWRTAMRLAAGIAATMASSFAVAALLKPSLGPVGTVLSAIAPVPILLWTVGSWLDLNRVTLVEAFNTRLVDSFVLLIVFAASIPVIQGIHLLIHRAVIGQGAPVMWLLLTMDALLVLPLGAALHGSALFAGYPTDRGKGPSSTARSQAT